MSFEIIIETLKNKQGIEFGGPTELFSGPEHNMELYSHVNLNGGNILNNNYFQSSIGSNFIYSKKIGKQFDIDCTDEKQLSLLERYDFVVTSHVIEHFANPINTLNLWKKYILKPDGYILSIIPNKDFCFDRKRPLTTLEHLILDYKENIGENDTTHIEEQKQLHDWSAGGLDNFYELCEINSLTRVVHHHTFNIELVEQMFSYSGFQNVASYIHNFYGTPLNIVNLSTVKNDNY